MSDTDDTDILLLIPPDFFVIESSDSEVYDETSKEEINGHIYEIESTLVNGLIEQVNHLENRICAIESLDSSCSATYSNELYNEFKASRDEKVIGENYLHRIVEMPVSSRFAGSLDSVNFNINLASDKQKNPLKSRHQFSLPSTPVNLNKRNFYTTDAEENRYVQLSSFVTDNFPNSNVDSGMQNYVGCSAQDEHTVENVTEKLSSHLIFNELNDIVDNNPLNFTKEQTLVSSSDKNKQSGMEGNGKSYVKHNLDIIGSIENEKLSVKNLELTEVNKLLKEMEETQSKIEKKLKEREMHNNCSDHISKGKTYQMGITAGSVPDLGFGVREMFYSTNDSEKDSHNTGDDGSAIYNGDCIEDICVKKKISQLGSQSNSNFEPLNSKCTNSPLSPRKTPQKGDHRDRTDSLASDFYGVRARRKINFSPAKSKSEYIKPYRNHNDNSVEKNASSSRSRQKDDCKSVHRNSDDDSSSDEKKKIGVEKNKNSSPYHSLKSKVKQMLMRDTDHPRGHFYNKMKYVAGTRSAAQDLSVGRSNYFLSLSDLWNSHKSEDLLQNNPVKLAQKLDEERFKREHCEQQIHELQKKILDHQESLAVAVEVDKEKDSAIQKLWNAWHQLATHWSELEEQRHALSKQLEEQSKMFELQRKDIKNKVDKWEKELSKALDLAADYKEKCQSIAKEREEFTVEMENKMTEALERLNEAKSQNLKCIEEKENLMDKLAIVEKESTKDKQLVTEYQKKLCDVEHKLSQLEADICILREQKENLSLRLKDEQTRNKNMSVQTISLQQVVDDYKKKEKILKDEVKNATERLELARVELRALYQGQLEAVVKEKLREFQSQLNAAEAAMRAELLSRENDLSAQATQQCQTLNERHKKELAAIEERHKSLIKMYNDKLDELEREKLEANRRLQSETDRRTEIAQKLHNVMETQWRQALQIISTSGDNEEKVKRSDCCNMGDPEDVKLDLQKLGNNEHYSGSSSNNDTAPFNRSDSQNTYRLSSKTMKNTESEIQEQQHQQAHLKKYIQMLLNRSPGNPLPGVMDQTTSSIGPDDLSQDSNIISDHYYSDIQIGNKIVPVKDRDKPLNKMKVIEAGVRPNPQNINKPNSKQPWR